MLFAGVLPSGLQSQMARGPITALQQISEIALVPG